MDFLDALVGSEWPALVGLTLYFLRNEIRQAAKALEEATIGSQNFKFRDRLDHAEALNPAISTAIEASSPAERAAIAAGPELSQAETVTASSSDGSAAEVGLSASAAIVANERIATYPPPYMVMAAWNELERTFYEAAGA
ncbi:MAG TPA: hypothetical protein VGG99_03285 [Acetobacteraceae bacterium]